MVIGYARVSRDDQDLGRQIRGLVAVGCEVVYEEKVSGSKRDRPEFMRMLGLLKAGDVVVVQKLDRLGRSLRDLIDVMERFKEVGVGFKVLDGSIDTTTASGELVFHILGAIAQFERRMIQERTKDALAHKRAMGVKLGRPRVESDPLQGEFNRLTSQGKGRLEIMEGMGITMYKYYALRARQGEEMPARLKEAFEITKIMK